MVLLAQAQNLVSFFVAIELLSVPLYVLCGSALRRRESLESGLKYLIVGSLGSATLLYGLAFIYGGSGSTDFTGIRDGIGAGLADDPLVLIGIGLAATGLAFKISIAPFHQWTPDVYQGAPTPVTAFMAVATKVAAFCVFVRFFEVALGPAVDNWQPALAVLAAVSIVVGNIGALGQDSLKRLLGYSGIAQAGYMLVGLVAASELGVNALVFYLAAYALMNLAAFAVIVVRERETEFGDDIRAVQGLGRDRPELAWPLTISMLALAGLPATAGFIGKLYLIEAAVDADYTWLGVAIAIGTMISLAYYLRVVAAVWMRPAAGAAGPGTPRGCRRWRAARRRPTRRRLAGPRRRAAGHPLPRDPGPRRGARGGDDLLRRHPLPAGRLGLERRAGAGGVHRLSRTPHSGTGCGGPRRADLLDVAPGVRGGSPARSRRRTPGAAEGLRGFDALGDRSQLEAAGDLDHRPDHPLIDLASRQAADELSVDLQVVHRQVLEVVERPETRPEVVEGELAAHLPDPRREAPRLFHVRDRRRLRDLEHQARRVDGRFLQGPLDGRREIGLDDRAGRDVDLQHNAPAGGPLGVDQVHRPPHHPASMSRAKPKRSAAGRKAPGGTSSSSSSAIRISSSYRAPGPSARSHDRLAVDHEQVPLQRRLDPLGPGQPRLAAMPSARRPGGGGLEGLRSVMSLNVTTAPSSWPRSMIGVLVHSTGKVAPLRLRKASWGAGATSCIAMPIRSPAPTEHPGRGGVREADPARRVEPADALGGGVEDELVLAAEPGDLLLGALALDRVPDRPANGVSPDLVP